MTKNNSKSQRALRKDQAEEREVERIGRSVEEQLALLDRRPGDAARERGRLA